MILGDSLGHCSFCSFCCGWKLTEPLRKAWAQQHQERWRGLCFKMFHDYSAMTSKIYIYIDQVKPGTCFSFLNLPVRSSFLWSLIFWFQVLSELEKTSHICGFYPKKGCRARHCPGRQLCLEIGSEKTHTHTYIHTYIVIYIYNIYIYTCVPLEMGMP